MVRRTTERWRQIASFLVSSELRCNLSYKNNFCDNNTGRLEDLWKRQFHSFNIYCQLLREGYIIIKPSILCMYMCTRLYRYIIFKFSSEIIFMLSV